MPVKKKHLSEQERKSTSESDRGDATFDRHRTARLDGPPPIGGGGEVTPKVILVAKEQGAASSSREVVPSIHPSSDPRGVVRERRGMESLEVALAFFSAGQVGCWFAIIVPIVAAALAAHHGVYEYGLIGLAQQIWGDRAALSFRASEPGRRVTTGRRAAQKWKA